MRFPVTPRRECLNAYLEEKWLARQTVKGASHRLNFAAGRNRMELFVWLICTVGHNPQSSLLRSTRPLVNKLSRPEDAQYSVRTLATRTRLAMADVRSSTPGQVGKQVRCLV
jgi:hypothetical protein